MAISLQFKNILKGLFSFGAAEGIAKSLNIVSILMMSYFLEVSVFGKVSLLLMFELLFLEMVVAGQHHSVLRYGAERDLYKTSLLGIGISLVSFVLWMLLISLFVDDINSISKNLLVLLLFAAFLQACIQIFLASCRVAGQIIYYIFIRVGYQLLKLVALFILISFERDVSFYPESLIAAGLITLLLIVVFNFFYRFNGNYNNREGNPSLVHNLKVGLPLGLHAIVGVTYTFIDRIMISRLLDLESLGVYQLASTLGLSAFFFVNVVALYFTPQIYANSGNLKIAKTLMNKFSMISTFGICCVSLVMYFLVINFIHFFDSIYSAIIPIFPYFVLVLLVQTTNLYGLYGLTMLEKVNSIPLVTAMALIAHFLLIQTLIPWMGIKGAVISLLVCELIYATTLFYMFSNEYKSRLGNA